MARERTVFVNGTFVPQSEAKISVFDRGFLMGDAVYEVCAVIGGKMLDNVAHLRRLRRSLGELNMAMPMSEAEIISVQEALISDNHLDEGLVYLQVTRGTAAERNLIFDPNMRQNVVMFTQPHDILHNPALDKGLSVMTVPDIRWQRRDIKTTQLLAQSLAKMIAQDAGYDDAWMIDDYGNITEGSSNNVWLFKGDRLFTRPLSHEILPGITRQTLLDILDEVGVEVVERPFSVREALRADELFVTSAGVLAMPVVAVDGERIGNGLPGAQTLTLREAYLERLCQA